MESISTNHSLPERLATTMHDLDSLIAELQNIRKTYGKNALIVAGNNDDDDPHFYDITVHYNSGGDGSPDDELAISQPYVVILLDDRREFKFEIGEKVIQNGDMILPGGEEVTIVGRRWEIDLDTNDKGGREMYYITGSFVGEDKRPWQIGVDKLSRTKIEDA